MSSTEISMNLDEETQGNFMEISTQYVIFSRIWTMIIFVLAIEIKGDLNCHLKLAAALESFEIQMLFPFNL